MCYCPVCYKPIPEEAYNSTYHGCIDLYGLDKYTGFVCTSKGTIKLGANAGEFESVYPKKIFTDAYDEIRKRQKIGSVRIGRCK